MQLTYRGVQCQFPRSLAQALSASKVAEVYRGIEFALTAQIAQLRHDGLIYQGIYIKTEDQ